MNQKVPFKSSPLKLGATVVHTRILIKLLIVLEHLKCQEKSAGPNDIFEDKSEYENVTAFLQV
jgi:hypothetical protein